MSNTVAVVKSFLENEDCKKRFQDVLGKKTNQFVASLLNTVSANKSIQECEPKSIISAALIAASFDLPIDSNLGFAAIVPYGSTEGKKAQFQIMAKGFIQLAIRSGQYIRMNYSEVYEDELKSYNPITKEIVFDATFKPEGQRESGLTDKIVGYFASFELITGFKQSMYMTVNEIRNHAKKYSKSYQYDLRKNSKSSRWSEDFDVMAKKTLIKMLLSKWGILSIDMQRAIFADQRVYDENGGEFVDNPTKQIGDTAQVEDPFKGTTHPAIEDQSQVADAEVVDPDAKLRAELQELHPDEVAWQIDARIKERKEAVK